MVKTSVIIPVYNTAPYLEECIDSVFNQTQKEIEVIAINDGSTDDSFEILIKLKKKYPQLIIYSQKNHGLGYTRNVGIEKAGGKYIYFLDSDDYIDENTLEACYTCAEKNDLDIVMFDAIAFQESPERIAVECKAYNRKDIVEETGEVFSGLSFLEKYYGEVFTTSAWLTYCSGDFLKRNQIRFLPNVYYEDNEFHCRIMLYADRVMYIPERFYRRRYRDDSITGKPFDLRRAKDYLKVIDATRDLQAAKGGKGKNIIEQIVHAFLIDLADRCDKYNLYHQGNQLSEQILNMWIKMCGCDIGDIRNLEELNFAKKICGFFPMSDLQEERCQIDFRKRQLLSVVLEQLPLNQENSRVAIYGCGDYTDKFLKLYRELTGEISAVIIFLDSYIKGGDKRFHGFPVYNICEINDKNPDYILISSPRYEAEMLNMVRQYCKENIKVILLYGDLSICP